MLKEECLPEVGSRGGGGGVEVEGVGLLLSRGRSFVSLPIIHRHT